MTTPCHPFLPHPTAFPCHLFLPLRSKAEPVVVCWACALSAGAGYWPRTAASLGRGRCESVDRDAVKHVLGVGKTRARSVPGLEPPLSTWGSMM
eukprot:1149081-Pelagomonas_calceolata.AAC.1